MTSLDTSSARLRPHRLGAYMALFASGLAFSAAHAQTVLQFEFAGVLTDISGNTGVFGPFNSVQLNDTFTGRFSYEVGPGNPDQDPADSQLGVYNLISFEIDQAVVPIMPLGIGVIHEPGLITLPPNPPDPGTDAFRVAGTFPIVDGIRPVTLRLAADYEAVFTDDSLPLEMTLTDFPVQHLVEAVVLRDLLGGNSLIDAGEITSLTLIPEPVTAVLIGMATTVTLIARRRAHFTRSVRQTVHIR